MENEYYQEQSFDIPQDRLSVKAYNVAIGLHLIYGIGLTALVCLAMGTAMTGLYAAHPFIFTLVFFVMSLFGTHMATKGVYTSSMLGYTITVIGFGGMLATFLPFYAMPTIFGAALMTLIVLVVMTLAAVFMPNAFLSLGKTLFIAVFGMIIAELAALLFGFYNNNLFAAVGVFVFALYIGYDWAKGQHLPRTAAYAVYTALGLYMDVVNIFVRLLSITRSSND